MAVSKEVLRRFFLSLSLVEGLGAVTIARVLEESGGVEGLYVKFLNNELTAKVRNGTTDVLAEERWKYLEDLGIKYICVWEKNYPSLLKEVPDPPPVLYYRGRLAITTSDMIVSIVGTRKLSLKGQRRTREWSMELAKRGYIIVSGMALGTDTIAHEACIAENGYTVAVLAGPVDRPYPASNVRLYNKICDSGLVVSEVFPKTPVVPGMFASRNRITAGLSKATIVIEAPIKSGSLITAKSAFDYDRYVFAVPGNDPCYAGCNLLIKENVAALSDSISDITSQLENSTS